MGCVRRVNLFPNPLFDPSGMTTDPFGTDAKEYMPGDGTFNPPYNMSLTLKGLIVGESYVLRTEATGDDPNAGIVSDTAQVMGRPVDGVITVRFTHKATDQSKDRILFTKGTYSHALVELARTFDDSLPYFDYKTMPREAGGGYSS